MEFKFQVGDQVQKVGGDYRFDGHVVAVFQKLSGAVRLVVEDDRGILHIYSEKNLEMLPRNEDLVISEEEQESLNEIASRIREEDEAKESVERTESLLNKFNTAMGELNQAIDDYKS